MLLAGSVSLHSVLPMLNFEAAKEVVGQLVAIFIMWATREGQTKVV